MKPDYILRDASTGLYLADYLVDGGAIILTPYQSKAITFNDELAAHHAAKTMTAVFGAFAFQTRSI